MQKKTLCIIFVILIIIPAIGGIHNIYQRNIYYNDKRIAQENDNYSVVNFSSNTNDIEEYKLSYSKISGDYLMWILNPKKETEITFNYDSDVYKGKFKVILVDFDKQEINNILEGSEEGKKQ